MTSATANAVSPHSAAATMALTNVGSVVGAPVSFPCPTGVRFALRKRTARPQEKDSVNLSSYNSDFLSGLFADVAKANVLSEFNIPEPVSAGTSAQASVSEEESSASSFPPFETSRLLNDEHYQSHFICGRPSKKSRLSLCSSFRSRSSCKNLAVLQDGLQSPKGINEFVSFQAMDESKTNHMETASWASAATVPKVDSLAYQLNCLSGADDIDMTAKGNSSATKSDKKTIMDAAKLAFPNLPATVSDSSCNTGLTRESLVQQVPTPETAALNAASNKDSFGWFVDLDDHHYPQENLPSSSEPLALDYGVSKDDLAFQAPTAPKRSSDDAEVEWAKAADTVDTIFSGFPF
jgi:hypothetical protein